MSAFDALLGDTCNVAVEPMRLWVTQTHETGATSTLHLKQDPDLGLDKTFVGGDLNAAKGGRLVICLDIDDFGDAVHFDNGHENTDETLKRGIEVLALALKAMQKSTVTG